MRLTPLRLAILVTLSIAVQTTQAATNKPGTPTTPTTPTIPTLKKVKTLIDLSIFPAAPHAGEDIVLKVVTRGTGACAFQWKATAANKQPITNITSLEKTAPDTFDNKLADIFPLISGNYLEAGTYTVKITGTNWDPKTPACLGEANLTYTIKPPKFSIPPGVVIPPQ